MEWMVYLLGAIAVGAVVLAIYERRKGKRLMLDDEARVTHSSDRAAFTEAERIRAQDAALHRPGGGTMF